MITSKDADKLSKVLTSVLTVPPVQQEGAINSFNAVLGSCGVHPSDVRIEAGKGDGALKTALKRADDLFHRNRRLMRENFFLHREVSDRLLDGARCERAKQFDDRWEEFHDWCIERFGKRRDLRIQVCGFLGIHTRQYDRWQTRQEPVPDETIDRMRAGYEFKWDIDACRTHPLSQEDRNRITELTQEVYEARKELRDSRYQLVAAMTEIMARDQEIAKLKAADTERLKADDDNNALIEETERLRREIGERDTQIEQLRGRMAVQDRMLQSLRTEFADQKVRLQQIAALASGETASKTEAA